MFEFGYIVEVYLGYKLKGYLSGNGKIVDILLARNYPDEKTAQKIAEKYNAKNNGYTYKAHKHA